MQQKNQHPKAQALVKAAGVDRLIFITDQARVADPEAVCAHLLPGSMVILRDYEHADRALLAKRLRAVTRQFDLKLLVAGDAALAKTVGADGLHLPEYQLLQSVGRPAFSLVTAACHNRRALTRAAAMGLDMALVSPLFATQSHAGTPALGPHRFARLIDRAGLPVAALGGITAANARMLKGLNIQALAGISIFENL